MQTRLEERHSDKQPQQVLYCELCLARAVVWDVKPENYKYTYVFMQNSIVVYTYNG